MDDEDAIQHGDLEDPTDVRLRDDQLQLTTAGAQALGASEQHSEGHRVDEGRVGQIDEHPPRPVVDDDVERVPKLRSGVQIRFPVHGDDDRAVREASRPRPESRLRPRA